jgi:hypothetical protein
MTTITINNKEYSKYSYIKERYNITADRLKKWREGKGAGSLVKLNYIMLDKGLYFYDLNDIEALIITQEHMLNKNI